MTTSYFNSLLDLPDTGKADVLNMAVGPSAAKDGSVQGVHRVYDDLTLTVHVPN